MRHSGITVVSLVQLDHTNSRTKATRPVYNMKGKSPRIFNDTGLPNYEIMTECLSDYLMTLQEQKQNI